MDSQLPPLEYLFDCSINSLQDLGLKMYDLAAQSEKQARVEHQQALTYRGIADICTFLANHRSDIIDLAKLVVDGKQRLLKFREPEEFDVRRIA